MTLSEEKKALRLQIRAKKVSHTASELKEQSLRLQKMILEHPIYKNAHTIMLYNALPDEVGTALLLKKALKDKRVILPKVEGPDIVPVEIFPDTDFIKGSFSIIEPEGETYHGDYDLIIIPGMAFDKKGNRLGRGKGFYDRFLVLHPHTPLMGLCYDFQYIDEIPTEDHDQRMTEIIHG